MVPASGEGGVVAQVGTGAGDDKVYAPPEAIGRGGAAITAGGPHFAGTRRPCNDLYSNLAFQPTGRGVSPTADWEKCLILQ